MGLRFTYKNFKKVDMLLDRPKNIHLNYLVGIDAENPIGSWDYYNVRKQMKGSFHSIVLYKYKPTKE